MNKTTFYEKALPSQGLYCVYGIRDSKPPQWRFSNKIQELLACAEQYNREGLNAYINICTFGDELKDDGSRSRALTNAVHVREFFLDLDVDPSKPHEYPSKEAALDALGAFLESTGIPWPTIMDSGGGIHAHWLFTQDIPVREWLVYAKKFRKFCTEQGLKFDAAVMTSPVRGTRVPGLLNYNCTPPAPAVLLSDEIEQFDFEDLKEFLGVEIIEEIPEQEDFSSVLASAEKGIDDDTRAVSELDNYEDVFEDLVVRSLTGDGCGQIRNMLLNPNSIPYPLWMAGLSIARRCVDWQEAIHKLSEGHASYSYANTEFKAEETLKVTGPHRCETFESLNPKGCEGCPYRGTIGTPATLGRKLRESPRGETDPVRLAADPQAIALLPEELRPFSRGINGGIFFTPPPEEDENGVKTIPKPVQVTEFDVFPIKRIVSGPDGGSLLMRHVMPNDPAKEFLLHFKNLAPDRFKEVMAFNEVIIRPKNVPLAIEYISRWANFMQRKETAEVMRMQMGWTEDCRAFIIGGLEIDESGTESVAAASPMIRNVSKLLKRVGDYETWQRSANAFNKPGFEQHALGMLAGFGSPLMFLTATPGAAICFMSADSGVGKTGALYAGISIWGNPKELSVLEGASTQNGFMGRYLGLKNILFGIDEASNVDPAELSKLIHWISQGKAKIRMQSSVNAERELEMSASLIAVMTSNQDLYDKLFTLKGSPDGEMARMIQFNMRKPRLWEEYPEQGPETVDKFRFNYGWAGPMFIKFLYSKGFDYAQKTIEKWCKAFRQDFGDDTAYRFHMNTIAACMAGGELAVEAGIINLDIKRIYNAAIVDLVQVRDKTIKLNNTDYGSLITEFYYENIDQFLIMNGGQVTQAPRNALVGRIEEDVGVFVSKHELKKFLATKQISRREFESALTTSGLLVGVKKIRLSTGWKAGTGATPPINVYEFSPTMGTDLLRNG